MVPLSCRTRLGSLQETLSIDHNLDAVTTVAQKRVPALDDRLRVVETRKRSAVRVIPLATLATCSALCSCAVCGQPLDAWWVLSFPWPDDQDNFSQVLRLIRGSPSLF